MAIERFYDTTALLERYTIVTDDYGQEIKTWSVSTTVEGTKQGRSGNKSIFNFQEKANKNERFYCDVIDITEADRLVFSTNTFNYQGTASASTDLTSVNTGAVYYVDTAFSTYVAGNYLRNNGTTYVREAMKYFNIIYVDNKRDRHLQIDLGTGYENQS